MPVAARNIYALYARCSLLSGPGFFPNGFSRLCGMCFSHIFFSFAFIFPIFIIHFTALAQQNEEKTVFRDFFLGCVSSSSNELGSRAEVDAMLHERVA